MNLNYHFGENLEKYLSIKNIKAVWLAEKMNISHQAIGKYFKSKSPRQATVTKILSVLNVSLEEFNSIVLEKNEIGEDYKTKYQQALNREHELLREIAELRKEKIKNLEAERIEGGNPVTN